MKLIKTIVYQARKHELSPAIASGGGIASYRTLINTVSAAVDSLKMLDLPVNKPVVIDIRNPVHHVATIFALALLGIPSASVSTAYSAQSAGPRPSVLLTDQPDLDPAGIDKRVVEASFFAFPADRPVDYARLLALPGFPDAGSVWRYAYSSGTTGRPKCVALDIGTTERRLANYMLTFTVRERRGAMLNLIGFSTLAGTTAPLIALPAGLTLCMAGSSVESLQMINLMQVSWLMTSVAQLEGLVRVLGNQPPPAALSRISVVGARLPDRLLAVARQRLCANVTTGYGSTEMGLVSGSPFLPNVIPEGYVGYVVPWVEMQMVDESDNPMPVGHPGIIRVRSEEQAYYVDEAGQPTETLRDGWFYPGDIGRLDSQGQLFLTGRTSEIINRGGVVVAPEAIEEVLRAVEPSLRDAAVLAATNAAGIDEIWAVVVAETPIDLQKLAEAARPRLNERTPERIFQVPALPRNDMGKVMRNTLREQLKPRN